MKRIFLLPALFLVVAGGISAQQVRPLDTVIEEAAKSVERALPQGTMLAVLNFVSGSEAFSDYVIEEFTGVLVRGRKVTVVDRRNLELIGEEMRLQLSGDVSDESAQAIGRRLGAQSIVSGSLSNMGNYYRFRIKVINVETAAIQEQSSHNLQNDAQVAFLLTGNRANVTPAAGTPPANTPSANTPAAPQPAPASTPAQNTPPRPQVSTDRPGLYVNNTFQGTMDLMDAVDWIALNARNGGNYIIVLGRDEAASNINLSYNNQQVSVTLKGSGGERKVQYDTQRPSYSLFTVGSSVTFVLEDGVVLTGLQSNGKPLVTVAGGTFTMNGGIIRDNSTTENGGGVRMESGTFTMNNGIISGNTVSGNFISGGGVYIAQGTFTMNNGTISGNTTNGEYGDGGRGGGVYIRNGTFTMNGGTISGNSAKFAGGGVYVDSGATFTKSGSAGIIYGSNAPDGQANKAYASNGLAVLAASRGARNTTARVSTALDSRRDGAAGGWE